MGGLPRRRGCAVRVSRGRAARRVRAHGHRARPDRPPGLVGGARPHRRRADPAGHPPLRHRRGARAGRRRGRHLDGQRAGRDHRHGPLDRRRLRAGRGARRCSARPPASRCCTRARCRSPAARGRGCGASWWRPSPSAGTRSSTPSTSWSRTPEVDAAALAAAEKEIVVVDEEPPPVTEPADSDDATTRTRRRPAGFWEGVGIDPIRITTRDGEVRHPALLPRRRAGLPRLPRPDRGVRAASGRWPAGSPRTAPTGTTWPPRRPGRRSSSRPGWASWRCRSTT